MLLRQLIALENPKNLTYYSLCLPYPLPLPSCGCLNNTLRILIRSVMRRSATTTINGVVDNKAIPKIYIVLTRRRYAPPKTEQGDNPRNYFPNRNKKQALESVIDLYDRLEAVLVVSFLFPPPITHRRPSP